MPDELLEAIYYEWEGNVIFASLSWSEIITVERGKAILTCAIMFSKIQILDNEYGYVFREKKINPIFQRSNEIRILRLKYLIFPNKSIIGRL